jgi:MEMO1 family protein
MKKSTCAITSSKCSYRSFYKPSTQVKILPILVSKTTDVKQVAIDIKEALIELKRNPIFIVSTDFTHYGPMFHYVPFVEQIQERMYALDKEAINYILKQDVEGFTKFAAERTLNYHGVSAIKLLLYLLKPCKVTLERYYTSGDVIVDYKNAVAYASITFE